MATPRSFLDFYSERSATGFVNVIVQFIEGLDATTKQILENEDSLAKFLCDFYLKSPEFLQHHFGGPRGELSFSGEYDFLPKLDSYIEKQGAEEALSDWFGKLQIEQEKKNEIMEFVFLPFFLLKKSEQPLTLVEENFVYFVFFNNGFRRFINPNNGEGLTLDFEKLKNFFIFLKLKRKYDERGSIPGMSDFWERALIEAQELIDQQKAQEARDRMTIDSDSYGKKQKRSSKSNISIGGKYKKTRKTRKSKKSKKTKKTRKSRSRSKVRN
jgi:hypothetical protein